MASSMVFCRGCAKEIHETAATCPSCGAPQGAAKAVAGSGKAVTGGAKSDKSYAITVLLCFVGLHRFYVGKIGTGILQLCTLGGFGVWLLVDLIQIMMQKFQDADGNIITNIK